jgi:hypothetical protein
VLWGAQVIELAQSPGADNRTHYLKKKREYETDEKNETDEKDPLVDWS